MSDQEQRAGGPPTERTRFRLVERIFFEAASLAPGDRDEAVTRLCAGDAGLESEVRALMSSAARIGSFLEQPALGKDIDQLARESTASEPPDELVGTTLGSFRVEKRIASGGMGTVYLAARNDGQFEQKAAIKVVKRGMDSEEILRRFRAERQTLAALDHINIARLIDGGVTPDGRPFLVMEYVDGTPIDVYCDQHRLKVRERLRLFRDVCDGVHHAHQNLVIHRDLKPSNILVTAQGVPKLLDFGISKVISGSGTDGPTTVETDRRLTPEYASPEQVEGGHVTTASDVYSLGVVLYELLTGTRPYHFGVRTTEELRRIICTLVPPPPSAAVTVGASRLRGTSGVVGGTPVVPGRSGAPGAAPATAGAPGGVDVPQTRGVSSTRLRSQLRGDLDNVVLMALRKEPQRRYASAEQFSADIGHFLSGLPVQARKDTVAYRASKFVRRHAVGVGLTVSAMVMLSTAAVVLYRQGMRLEQQRDELVASNRILGETRRYLLTVISGAETGNQGPDARLGDVLRDAAHALRVSPPSDPLTLAAAEQALGRSEMTLGMLVEARPLLESAERGLSTLPDDADSKVDIGVDLAELLYFEGRHAEAESRFRDLLQQERVRAGGVHTEREGLLLNDLGASQRVQGKVDEAIATQREAIAVRSAVNGEKSLPVAESQNNLASGLFQKGDVAGAIEQFQRVLETREALLRPDHPLIVRVRANLGLAELRAGRPERAIVLLSAAAEAWERAFGPDHPGRVPTITSLSQALRRLGRPDEAIVWLRRALEWQTAHQPKDSPQIAATEANIGVTLAENHRDAEARPLLERTLPVLRNAGPGSAGIARSASESLAAVYERAGMVAEAKAVRDAMPSK